MDLKIAVLGSEKAVFGFTVAGFSNEKNILLIFNEDFDQNDLNIAFKNILNRDDVGIVFIAENLMSHLEKEINDHKKLLPSILKIPVLH
jgi:vacuolar-type H+-ATPase subunit F/Vma7